MIAVKTWFKVFWGISLSFMCLFACVGYAAISGNLTVSGNVQVEQAEFDSMVITDVSACSGTTASQSAKTLLPTNVKTTITGKAGDKVVYKITAYNDSEANTYVLAGAQYDESYAAVGGKLNISTSIDEQNRDKIPVASGTNFYQGTPIAPGEEITFYATYVLNSDISAGEILINFKFVPVIYTVTYIVDNEVHAVDCVVDNSVEYQVTRRYVSADASMEFDYWMNAGSSRVTSVPESNTENVNLYPSYVGVYTATFVDHDANIVAWDHFTKNNYKNITALGNDTSIRPVVEDCEFDYWQVRVTKNGTTTTAKLSDYKFSDNVDVTIYPVYTYKGDVNLIPVDRNSDGITDEYQVGGYRNPDGQDLVVIPDYVNGIPITTINANAFSSYEGVHSLVIPATVTSASGNILAANWSFMDKGETVTIYYAGTREQWIALEATFTKGWDNGLGASSRVFFLNEAGKVDVSQGYMQAKLNTNWIGTGQSLDWNYQSTISSVIRDEYDNTCTCNDCKGQDRPDRHYWTGVVITK